MGSCISTLEAVGHPLQMRANSVTAARLGRQNYPSEGTFNKGRRVLTGVPSGAEELVNSAAVRSQCFK
jgi:hypothetical protein